MKFKDWYLAAKRDNDDFVTPYIKIKDSTHYKLVIENLKRLGFLDGNDFSGYDHPVTVVDIWYDDFWNSHIMPINHFTTQEGDFEFTIDELIDINKRDNF